MLQHVDVVATCFQHFLNAIVHDSLKFPLCEINFAILRSKDKIIIFMNKHCETPTLEKQVLFKFRNNLVSAN